jgi:hypothetical protein
VIFKSGCIISAFEEQSPARYEIDSLALVAMTANEAGENVVLC